MELKINAQAVLVTCENYKNIHAAVRAVEKIDGVCVSSGHSGLYAQQGNEIMIFIIGVLGNRSDFIIKTLKENGCSSAEYVSDDVATSFMDSQDIYS